MQIKSLLVTLGLLGSSSVALAEHSFDTPSWRDREPDRDRSRFDRDARRHRDLQHRDLRHGDPGRRDFRVRDADRFGDRHRYRDVDRLRDPDRVRDHYRLHRTWIALTSPERLARGAEVFDLHTRAWFGQLRLQNQTGRMFVRQIEIVFADGERKIEHVHRTLDGNHAMVNIDLGAARRIDHVIVDGHGGRASSFQLYAM